MASVEVFPWQASPTRIPDGETVFGVGNADVRVLMGNHEQFLRLVLPGGPCWRDPTGRGSATAGMPP